MITKGINVLFVFVLLMMCARLCNAADTASSIFDQTFISEGQIFKVKAHPKEVDFIPVNRFHRWVINIQNMVGNPVYPARIAIGGGMPAHGHGLPTQPEVTKYLGDGSYLIEGLKFNMDGEWLIKFRIITPETQDTVEMNVEVNY